MSEKETEGNGKKTIDPASEEVLDFAEENDMETAWDRLENMKPQCKYGKEGVCCTNCSMGPCRIIPGKSDTGVCGATAATIAARNLVRMIAGGAAAHSDHGRDVVHTLEEAVKEDPDYEIKDEEKLKKMADDFGISKDGDKEELAEAVAEEALAEFGRQEGELAFARKGPGRPSREMGRRRSNAEGNRSGSRRDNA